MTDAPTPATAGRLPALVVRGTVVPPSGAMQAPTNPLAKLADRSLTRLSTLPGVAGQRVTQARIVYAWDQLAQRTRKGGLDRIDPSPLDRPRESMPHISGQDHYKIARLQNNCSWLIDTDSEWIICHLQWLIRATTQQLSDMPGANTLQDLASDFQQYGSCLLWDAAYDAWLADSLLAAAIQSNRTRTNSASRKLLELGLVPQVPELRVRIVQVVELLDQIYNTLMQLTAADRLMGEPVLPTDLLETTRNCLQFYAESLGLPPEKPAGRLRRFLRGS